jgi:hypothetical protein
MSPASKIDRGRRIVAGVVGATYFPELVHSNALRSFVWLVQEYNTGKKRIELVGKPIEVSVPESVFVDTILVVPKLLANTLSWFRIQRRVSGYPLFCQAGLRDDTPHRERRGIQPDILKVHRIGAGRRRPHHTWGCRPSLFHIWLPA